MRDDLDLELGLAEQRRKFDLKLLTASKDVGLRRLRSYAASLGGGAQIFQSFEDIQRNLEASAETARHSIVLHDSSLALTNPQISSLAQLSRVFHLHQPRSREDLSLPQAGSPCWGLEAYLRCSLTTFFESPIVRISMAHLCDAERTFHLEHLLRWGYAAHSWRASDSGTIADASEAFVRELKLAGESRRLTEMASHFLQTRLPNLGVQADVTTFGSDGLLTMVIARGRLAADLALRELATELRIHDFPIAIVNCLEGGLIEIAAMHYLDRNRDLPHESILMTFGKMTGAAQKSRADADTEGGATLASHWEKAG